jgi:hypothetical protein
MSCGASIVWAYVLDEHGQIKRRPDGRLQRMPVDADPHPEGRVVVYARGDEMVARVLRRDEEPRVGEKTRKAHHITCPHAADWRAASKARRAS